MCQDSCCQWTCPTGTPYIPCAKTPVVSESALQGLPTSHVPRLLLSVNLTYRDSLHSMCQDSCCQWTCPTGTPYIPWSKASAVSEPDLQGLPTFHVPRFLLSVNLPYRDSLHSMCQYSCPCSLACVLRRNLRLNLRACVRFHNMLISQLTRWRTTLFRLYTTDVL
jgi:hypothetical protein